MGSFKINNDEAFIYAAQLASFSVLPMTLTAAVELDLFDIIIKAGPGAYLSSSEIVAKLPTQNPQASEVVDRMLRMLAGFDVVTLKSLRTGEASGRMERRYGANEVTKYFCKDEGGGSLALASKLFNDPTAMEAWYNLKNAVLEGGDPFSKAQGMNTFEFAKANPRFNSLFNEAMKGYSRISMKMILDVCTAAFDHLNVLVDVGGGTGATLCTVIARHPHIKGINFDLPHVIREAPSLPGIVHIGGDMFESVPSTGDAILLKTLCCDWDDEHVLKILKNCWKALRDNGKVIIINEMLPMIVEGKPSTSLEKYSLLADLLDLVLVPSGKVRSEEEFENLSKSAGFSRFARVGTCADVTIMECYK